jgi:ABC-type oligopeptide transport system ATPase subunit
MNNRIKHREIQFDTLHPDPDQAHRAMLCLADLEGVESSLVQSSHQLLVSYDVGKITLDDIVKELIANRFHIYNSLLFKLKQALYSYTEQTEQANLITNKQTSSREMFVKQYQRRPHGCRDQRPHHWRHYL